MGTVLGCSWCWIGWAKVNQTVHPRVLKMDSDGQCMVLSWAALVTRAGCGHGHGHLGLPYTSPPLPDHTTLIFCEVEGRPARGNIIASGEKGRVWSWSWSLLRQKGSKVDRAFLFTFLG